METTRTTFFTRDKNFYKTFFRLMLVVALQNLVAYQCEYAWIILCLEVTARMHCPVRQR